MRPSARVAFGGRRGMSDLAGWLKKLGLEQYAEVFERNGVDRDSLAHLGEPDLVALGLLLGHRRILQAALTHEAARASQAAAASTAFPTGARTAASDEAERRLLTVLFCLSGSLQPPSGPLWRLSGQVHGRRRAGLLRLSDGPRR